MGGKTAIPHPSIFPESYCFTISHFPTYAHTSSFVCPKDFFPKRGGINLGAAENVGVVTVVLIVNYFPPHGVLIKMVYVYPRGKEAEV